MMLQALMQKLGGHPRQQTQLQRNGQHYALAKSTVRGNEKWTLRQSRMVLDLWRMLVRQPKAINLKCWPCNRTGFLIQIDARAPAPRIARHGVHSNRIVRWN